MEQELLVSETLTESPTLFDRLDAQAPDPLLALIGLFAADQRPGKIDVGVGVYRDAAGGTPIPRAVKAAEKILWETQETKSYLSSQGDLRYLELIKTIAFGEAAANDGSLLGIQTPGGCGALRLGAELAVRADPQARIYVGTPTWPNHEPLIGEVGVEMVDYPFYDKGQRVILFDRMMSALEGARAGDLVLLHGCCHNPTGADFELEQWQALAEIVSRRGLIPFIDFAYQGLGRGLEGDAVGTRLVVEAAEQALIAHSCDKNFGCYRDRLGSLWIKMPTASGAERVLSNMLGLARTNWSVPPDHMAAVARIILDDAELRADWMSEVEAMGARIRQLRARLAAFDPRLAYIGDQYGMFSMLPLTPDQVLELRNEHGIYMAGSGRFNVVGLSDANVDQFAAAVVEKLP